MRGSSTFQVILSAAVIAVGLGFLVFMRLQTGIGTLTGYPLSIEMKQVDGLAAGAEVRVSGIKVGKVTGLGLSPDGYSAIVDMEIRSDIGIPRDSSFTITAGTMSGTYLSINPGKSGQKLAPGGLLRLAQARP